MADDKKSKHAKFSSYAEYDPALSDGKVQEICREHELTHKFTIEHGELEAILITLLQIVGQGGSIDNVERMNLFVGENGALAVAEVRGAPQPSSAPPEATIN
jgi:hypothetical protein